MPSSGPSSPLKVSVALCTCNGSRFIAQQLQSIAAQTHPVDEIILCDDASTDSTLSTIKNFAAASPISIKIQSNPHRLGVTANFAKAISACTGDIIFLCDQDDLWHPQKVHRLLQSFSNDAVALTFSNAQVVHEDLTPADYTLWDSIWFTPAEQAQMQTGFPLPPLLRHAIAAGSTLAFRSRYLPLILPIPEFPHSHDIWITLLLASIAPIAPVNQPLIQYRLHDSNQVGLKRHNLLSQYRMAKHQIQTQAFAYAADLHRTAYDRLKSGTAWIASPQSLKLLEEKIHHSESRHNLPNNRLARFKIISSELRKGNYSKYSYGFKSVLQDLFLR